MSERCRQHSQWESLLFWYSDWTRKMYPFFHGQSKTPGEKWGKKKHQLLAVICVRSNKPEKMPPLTLREIFPATLGVSTHWLLLQPLFEFSLASLWVHPWCYIRSLQSWVWTLLHESQCSPGTARLGCSMGEGELWGKQQDQGRSSGNNYDQPQSRDVQARPKWQGRSEVKLGTRVTAVQGWMQHTLEIAQARAKVKVPSFSAAPGPAGDERSRGGWSGQWQLAGDSHHKGKPRNNVTPWLVKHF